MPDVPVTCRNSREENQNGVYLDKFNILVFVMTFIPPQSE